jgi:hypothetical protein
MNHVVGGLQTPPRIQQFHILIPVTYHRGWVLRRLGDRGELVLPQHHYHLYCKNVLMLALRGIREREIS